MKRILGVACSALILAGCSSPLFVYDPETVDAIQDRLPTSEPSYTTPDFVEAYRAIEAGNYVEAEVLLVRSISAQPNDPYALLAMGAVMERTGRPFDASTYYRSAAQYGEAALLGETLALDDDAVGGAKTVRDLAIANVTRLEGQ